MLSKWTEHRPTVRVPPVGTWASVPAQDLTAEQICEKLVFLHHNWTAALTTEQQFTILSQGLEDISIYSVFNLQDYNRPSRTELLAILIHGKVES